jgi:hypothetical protein
MFKFAILFVASVTGFNAGVDSSLDISVVEQAKDVYWSYVME